MAQIAPEELGCLYRKHANALRLFARQFDGAEDLVHEAFIKLAQQSPAPEKVLPWLYRVVRNAASATGRGEARRRRRQNAVGNTTDEWFASADDQIDGREATQLLAELPLEQREVIVARIWGGLTFDEVAQLVVCSLPTAHRRYQAGLAALRERLETPCTRTSPSAKTI